MNNTDFRRLVSDTPRRQQDGSSSSPPKSSATPMSLGSRTRASIPMTPRTVKGAPHMDFARQVAERNSGSQPPRKFRSMAAPKGSKLASGYTDRVRDRNDSVEKDDKEVRIKALEEQMKLGQIERAVFESLRDEITGGDISATHLVKGLDRKLLERVKKGEDVLSSQAKDTNISDIAEPTSPPLNPDDELDKFEAVEIKPVEHEKTAKKGEMAPPPKPLAGTKRSRNDILAELKASREAAKAAAQPQLGARFRKVGERSKAGSRIERDEKGREVLITVDEDGRVKRKVRKTAGEEHRERERTASSGLLMPELGAAPLGMEVPITVAAPTTEEEEEEEEDDIFANVGAEYNPLGDDANADDASSSSEDDDDVGNNPSLKPNSQPPQRQQQEQRATADTTTPAITPSSPHSPSESPAPPPPAPAAPTQKKQNYFSTSTTTTTTSSPPPTHPNPLTDPTLLTTLRHAASLPLSNPSKQQQTEKQSTLLSSLLSSHDRDLEDMDLGFGSSRFGDAEDADDGAAGGGKGVKLSLWKGLVGGDGDGEDGEDGDGGEGGGGEGGVGAKGVKGRGGRGGRGGKRGSGRGGGGRGGGGRGGGGGGGGGGERKNKKKKGSDKDSVADVLGVLEGRRKAAGT